MDVPSNVLQADVSTEVELIVTACELVGPDPQIELDVCVFHFDVFRNALFNEDEL